MGVILFAYQLFQIKSGKDKRISDTRLLPIHLYDLFGDIYPYHVIGSMSKSKLKLPRAPLPLNISVWDFPGGVVVGNLPSSAGDMGSTPGWGTKIPHAAGQVSPRATTAEPVRSELAHCN